MRFPGRRQFRHYFPTDKKSHLTNKRSDDMQLTHPYIVGMDQVLVDIDASVDELFLKEFGLEKGMSQVIEDDVAAKLTQVLAERQLINTRFAGGTIGNTMHNYSVLADDRSVLLGVMTRLMEMGSDAYRFVCNNSSRVDLEHLQPVDGPIGRNFTLITADGERTFAFNPGWSNKLEPDYIKEELIKESGALVISAYLMRAKEGEPMPDATLKAIEYANQAGVPVVLSMGTSFFIKENPTWWRDFVRDKVDVIAMNEEEAEALTGHADPLLASEKALDWVDLVLCTAGPEGLYLSGYTDKQHLRETEQPLLPGAISEFNRYEYSRPMRRQDCDNAVKVYSHIAPYMGGPEKIKNTNGAGDGALAALLHDMVANLFHRSNVPGSEKHQYTALAYSSFSQICKYANRVSFEVLMQHSPRLSKGLPDKEDSLEQSYWAN